MHALKTGFLLLALLVSLPALAPPAAAQQAAQSPQVAQASQAQKLETAPLAIETAGGNRYVFEVELALTPQAQGRGLMFRESLPPNGGMLFIFPVERPASFWMKNTPLSLDIIFIRADGTIANIHEQTEPFSEASLPSDGYVLSVLEVKGGTAAQLSIKAGDRVVFPVE